jgi:hypothetical protein
VLRAGTEDAAHRDVGGLEADEVVPADQGARGAGRLARRPGRRGRGPAGLANRVACNVAALQGSYASVLEPGYVLA